MASMKDPGGNIIDLYQPTPEKVQKIVKDVVTKDQEKGGDKGGLSAASSSEEGPVRRSSQSEGGCKKGDSCCKKAKA